LAGKDTNKKQYAKMLVLHQSLVLYDAVIGYLRQGYLLT